jgi:DNA-binding IclR family transcriptional regulator
VESVRRAIAILHSFSLEKPELGVTELSRDLEVHKSTVSRLLATLEIEGLVDRNPVTGRYRLGVGLIELAGFVTVHTDLQKAARPFLSELAELTKETVNLAVLNRNGVINIELVLSPNRRVSNIGWVGRRTPLHASSTGKVLMAYLPEARLSQLLREPLVAYTEHTVTDLDELGKELALVRQRGFAIGLEELEIGLNAVAAPIRDHTGKVIAAVSTAGPSYRLSKSRIVDEVADYLIEYGRRISQALGYSTA